MGGGAVEDNIASARAVVAEADAIHELVDSLAEAPEHARDRVRAAYVDSREAKVVAQLDGVDVASLRDVTRERLRIGTLTTAGVRSVGQVVRLGQGGLEDLDGIGPQTAGHLLGAAEQVASAMRSSVRFRIDMDPADPVATALLQALHGLGEVMGVTEKYAGPIERLRREHARVRGDARNLTSTVRRLFAWGERRRRAQSAVATLAALVDLARRTGLAEEAERVVRLLVEPLHPIEVWQDFAHRAADYYALLDDVEPTRRDQAATQGHLPSELVESVQRQELDTTLLTASLRGYQAFGARFALAQRRVVLGDEMGLGKTVQAIAVMAHLINQGAQHALVVCPASVLAGWTRELAAHSTLGVHLLHGDGREAATAQWRALGGVGVMSYAGLRWHRRDVGAPDVLVVDEAHYVKNPEAHRSQAVSSVAAEASTVLFLTGTVMQNRVEEFRTVLSYLQPELAENLDPALGLAGPEAFRRAVAPGYLRRNADDVLEELPELVQVEDWEEFGAVDGAAYRRAVQDGSFMAMRRAAYAVERPEQSAKVERLIEIVDEALDNGRKVVVFSFFRDVVALVSRALGELALEPLTGSVGPARRQAIIDEFTVSERPCVLVSQIGVGGVGLNLQAASIVILCEPQTTPTTESQAISRARRMGQVRTVHVHRLLVADSVDEHLMRMLDSKRHLFDVYARRSALAEEVAEAVDVSEAELARQIVEAERTRLFVDPNVLSVEDA